MIGIYKITNPEGKVYIGQSIDIYKRWKSHVCTKNYSDSDLAKSFRSHGFDNHLFEVIENCGALDLNERERYWQEHYNVLEEGLNGVLTKTKDKPCVVARRVIEKKPKRIKRKTTYVPLILEEHYLNELKRQSQKVLGRVNVTGYIRYLINKNREL